MFLEVKMKNKNKSSLKFLLRKTSNIYIEIDYCENVCISADM
jgi:hypothetical protein